MFAWRKLYKEGLLDAKPSQDCKLLPVMLAELPPTSSLPISVREVAAPADGVIHLAVGKVQLRLEGHVDAATLALMLEHLLR